MNRDRTLMAKIDYNYLLDNELDDYSRPQKVSRPIGAKPKQAKNVFNKKSNARKRVKKKSLKKVESKYYDKE